MACPSGELSAEQTEGAEKAEVFLSAGVRSRSSLPPSKPAALPPPSSEVGNGDAAESRSEGKAIPLSPRCARHFPRRGKHLRRATPGMAPPTGELSAEQTEGGRKSRSIPQRKDAFPIISPSVKACGFATSLVRGRQWGKRTESISTQGQRRKAPNTRSLRRTS